MSKVIINSSTVRNYELDLNCPKISVSEMFSETLQGEGVNIGRPATFLRLGGCHINCKFCDTSAIWRKSLTLNLEELFKRMELGDVINRLSLGEHLVVTGGAPLLQQDSLLRFFEEFEKRYGFVPYIQIENECTIKPDLSLIKYISCWNNSPKLSNSGTPLTRRYKPKLVKYISSLPNSWFKFVVESEKDWEEICTYFLDTKIIKKEQVILMPMGYGRKELEQNRLKVAEMAMKYCVRFSDRLQVTLYDKKIGV